MFSKLFAVCLIAVQATSVAAFMQPGVYRITSIASHSTVQTYNPNTPLFISSSRENPGPFELFNIQPAPNAGGYTIKNVGLGNYVSAPEEEPGVPLFANGNQEVFAIDPAGGDQVVIKVVNTDLLWTMLQPVILRGLVVLNPSNGEATQRYTLSLTSPDVAHHTSSAKFSATQPIAEDCGHKSSKWNIYKPVEVMLQYLPFGAQ